MVSFVRTIPAAHRASMAANGNVRFASNLVKESELMLYLKNPSVAVNSFNVPFFLLKVA